MSENNQYDLCIMGPKDRGPVAKHPGIYICKNDDKTKWFKFVPFHLWDECKRYGRCINDLFYGWKRFCEQQRKEVASEIGCSEDYIKGIEDAFAVCHNYYENIRHELDIQNDKVEHDINELKDIKNNMRHLPGDIMNIIMRDAEEETTSLYDSIAAEHGELRMILRERNTDKHYNITSVPKILNKIENIEQYIEKSDFGSIYFLVKNYDEIVYVGQTEKQDPGCRVTQHRKDKDFSNVFYFNCLKIQLNDIESFYIKKFKPKYNVAGNNDVKSIAS